MFANIKVSDVAEGHHYVIDRKLPSSPLLRVPRGSFLYRASSVTTAQDDTKPLLQDPILRSDPIETEEAMLRLPSSPFSKSISPVTQ
ncbi:hypothetical protein Leryth_019162 [Lithospermum erythrorhizon]|nr:hypothetical protein Leryth_019162 [Lithospermum erythrorhizon]